jgi:DNA-binding MarR family transcriptional regulator
MAKTHQEVHFKKLRQELEKGEKSGFVENFNPQEHLEQLDKSAIYEFTDEEREQVLRALKDYEDGNFISDEESEEKIQQWLKE